MLSVDIRALRGILDIRPGHVGIITNQREKALRRFRKIAALGLILAPPGAAADTCRQALILGLDVSLSVDVFDFALQRGGLVRALEDPQVVDALTAPGGNVMLAVFEWSGQFNQTLLVDWTQVEGPQTLAALSIQLRDAPQGIRSGRTGLGRRCFSRAISLGE